MNTINIILLLLWIFIFIDSIGAIFCKYNTFCSTSSIVKYITHKNLPLSTNWPFIYLFLAMTGLITIIIASRQKQNNCKEDQL